MTFGHLLRHRAGQAGLHELWIAERGDEEVHAAREFLDWVVNRMEGGRVDHRHEAGRPFVEAGLGQRFLAREMVEERALGDARLGAYLVDRRRHVAVAAD